MKRFGLAARVAVAIAVIAILTAGLTTGAAIVSTSSQVRGDIDDFLVDRAEEILDGTRQAPDRRDRDREIELDGDTIDEIDEEDLEESDLPGANEVDAEVQLLDIDGAVVASTGLDLPVTSDEVSVAVDSRPPRFRTVTLDGGEYRIYTAPILDGGAVQVATSLDDATSLIGGIRNRLLGLGLIVAAVGALAGWLLTRRSLRPLGELAEAAERVAETQDLDTAIPVERSDDEIGRLAMSMNEMLDALSSSREQQHRLVQDAAHELRTPLTSVNANVDLLLHARNIPDDERHDILTGIRAELGELGTLFKEIIELATDKRVSSAHEPVALAGVVQRAVDDLGRRTENSVEVSVDDSTVLGDEPALHRAVTNLLSNAAKYSPEGAPIAVDVRDGRVSVTDAGPGIPADERERIFDRFYRLDESRAQPGTGLGLAIVAKIISDHKGSTFVDDANPGPGAVVGFTLPVLDT